jgi:cobaltochelatase CobN
MHLLVRETHALDEGEDAVDLGQTPGDIVVLSFSDSDLGALASAWQAMDADRPSLRLANLVRLRHPMSVDLYVEAVIAQARCVVIRLLGGLEYWRYGVEEAAALCAREGIALAIVPGDGRADARLAELSTVPRAVLGRLDAMLAQGGPDNMRAALCLAAHAGGLAPDPCVEAMELPLFGEHVLAGSGTGPLAAIVFYRSYLLAGDMAPILALAEALRARGMAARSLYVASLKEPGGAAFVAATLRDWRPAVVLNATGFSARSNDSGSPLDAADAPVLQVVLSGSALAGWQASARGLSQADLAMQVVLPELDGRLLTAAISFKGAEDAVPGLEYARMVHRAHEGGIAIAADRAAGWARLATTPRDRRQVAMVLSNYPNAGGQMAHAVGLDAFASAAGLLELLAGAGYRTAPCELVDALTVAAPQPILAMEEYRALFADLPAPVQRRVIEAWGEPKDDPAVVAGHFTLGHVRAGHVVVAIEPDRGSTLDRKAGYHDPDLPPRHLYVAFHLWLRHRLGVHALLHLGAHGTLEWLPGKSVALTADCLPQALLGGTPVVYPFIANNPGEAAAAKRRLGAVTIGHLTPPLREAGLHGDAAGLERLMDEYAAADGLDRRRAGLLRRAILELAETCGVLAESGADPADEDAALARLDAYLCDVKELQIRDGLHVFGAAPADEARARLLDSLRLACPATPAGELAARLDASPAAENAALLAALDGRFVAPGPAGAPSRGRADVLPTGRNLTATDPRTMPTRAAVQLAGLACTDLLRRHRQDHGEWPRAIVINLWGSASMRTGGEDLALALELLGARPVWDDGSSRVTGIEVLPLAVLDRPRVDVTLRISGLFRDAFETQILLFDSAVRAIAARDEAEDWNPLAGVADTARVFGPAAGAYGAGLGDRLGRGDWKDRDELGLAYLDASSTAYGQEADPRAFSLLVAAADAFVQQQDHREMDLLEGSEHAAHEGGFAAAAASLGNRPALYHADTSRPDGPRTATTAEEIALVVRARAANPLWLAGMMRHGYRGGAEIARAVEGLSAFAATLPDRLDRQFDLLFDATLGTPEVDAFLVRDNPRARADMQARFHEALRRGLWRPRRNDVSAELGA